MKNFYVIKDDDVNKIFTKQEFHLVQEYMQKNPLAYMKGFYKLEDAQKYSKNKKAKFYYVIIQKSKNWLLTNKDDILIFKDDESAIIRTTKNKSLADKWVAMSYNEFIEYSKHQKEEKEEKQKRKEKKEKQKEETRKYLQQNFKIKDRYIGFIDCEANCRYAISIGISIYDTQENEIVDTYYSLVKYKTFECLDKYVEKLTHLTTNMIKQAPNMDVVANEISAFLKKYNIHLLYAWGPDDKKYVQKYQSEYDKINEISNKIVNIQKIISSVVYETFHNDSISLDNMKRIYHIDDKKVTHNALDDAIDLTNVFKAWFTKQPTDTNIQF